MERRKRKTPSNVKGRRAGGGKARRGETTVAEHSPSPSVPSDDSDDICEIIETRPPPRSREAGVNCMGSRPPGTVSGGAGLAPPRQFNPGQPGADMMSLLGGFPSGNMVQAPGYPRGLPAMMGAGMGNVSMGFGAPFLQGGSTPFDGGFAGSFNGAYALHIPWGSGAQGIPMLGGVANPGLPIGTEVQTASLDKQISTADRRGDTVSAPLEEVKEEEDDDLLRPTPGEAPLVATLMSRGLPADDALLSLRACGNQVQAAFTHALQSLAGREESRAVDAARLESEKEKEKIEEQARREELELTVHGDIIGKFQESFLLDEREGCKNFREAIVDMCSGKGSSSSEMCAFRENAVKLLFLERKTLKWYREARPQVQGYFRKLIGRLESLGSGAAGARECSNTGLEAEAQIFGPLAEAVGKEISTLREILFSMPTTSGGVPDAFLECIEHMATLDEDGVQELSHHCTSYSQGVEDGHVVIDLRDDD
ncbi:unnamed protein product [Discosporangium mesarthrocarpum]